MTVLAAVLSTFATSVQQSAPDPSAVFNSPPGQGPQLIPSDTGRVWVVTQIAATLARAQLWQMLLAPSTFGGS